MSYRNLKPAEARELLDGQGEWQYLDVRTVEEFAQGHCPGAYNIPVFFRDPLRGMTPNDDFVEQVQRHFSPARPLVVGCAAGGRSARACELLEQAGHSELVNMLAGFHGARDATGQITEAGWAACSFPVATEAESGRSYTDLGG